jgi:hypothetical protein
VIASLSLIGVALGTLIACIANRYPRQKKYIEPLAGFLLISGFALFGYGLERIFGQP